jgi:hypothetical protein
VLCNFTNAGITDATAKNVLETVGTAQISTTQSKFGGGAVSLPSGTFQGSYLASQSPVITTSGPFTFECWFLNNDTSKNHNLWVTPYQGYEVSVRGISVNPTLGFCWLAFTVGFTNIGGYQTGYMPPLGQWVHLAVTRDASNTWRFFVNGVLYENNRVQATWNGFNFGPSLNDGFGIRGWNVGTSAWNGDGRGNAGNDAGNPNCVIDDMRITIGFARYTANFTAPTAAFPLQ